MHTTHRTVNAIALAVLIAALIVMGLQTAFPRGADAATIDRYGCGDIEDYRQALIATLPEPTADEERTVMAFFDGELDFDTMRPSQARSLSGYFDRWAANLEDMDPADIPPVAEDHHDAITDTISVLSSAFNAYATGGVFALLPYTEAIDSATLDMDSATRYGARTCGTDWTDVFGTDDGITGDSQRY